MFLVCLFVFPYRVLLCSPSLLELGYVVWTDWPRTHKDLPDCAFQVLGFKACTNIPGAYSVFIQCRGHRNLEVGGAVGPGCHRSPLSLNFCSRLQVRVRFVVGIEAVLGRT